MTENALSSAKDAVIGQEDVLALDFQLEASEASSAKVSELVVT
jgi:hypothetical protein